MRTEAELVALRKLAEQLAAQRGEKTTTGHLLAAIASCAGPAQDLLSERRLDEGVLLKAARITTDDHPDAIQRSVQRARDLALRSGPREPGALHLLFALCQERSTAAHRALEQCGADVVRLRTQAMQVAMGILPARRKPASLPPPSLLGAPQPARTVLPPAPPTAATPPASIPPPPVSRPSAPPPPATTAPTAVPPAKQKHAHAHGSKKRASSAGAAAERFALDPKRFPTLTALGRNLTLAAARGELDPVFGREEETERALDVLAKRHASCPLLVGPAGVGKTSVVRGLAARIAEGRGVTSMDDRVVIEIDPPALLAGTAVRGSLAERLAQIKAEVRASEGRVVVFFDEIHTLLGDAAGDEAKSELKVALARGELSCIGATTPEEYKRFVEADAAIARRFTVVEVGEPSPEEAALLCESLAPAFERHHGVRYADGVVGAAVAWSVRYVTTKTLPDKAVSILDLAGARARRRGILEVTQEQLAEVVSDEAHVPVERLLETDGERMLRLEETIAARVVGHKEAISRIAAVLRKSSSGFRYRRPLGSFLLLGPTGVGKTETAKAIAECLFFDPNAMSRLDMSEFAEPHAIARLVGAPPGYVGHESGGQLTEAVRRRPYQVILLDEIEKAHRDVLEAFLQVFDEGRLTDGRGRTVDFTNTVLVLTSNLGAEVAVPKSSRRIGFSRGDAARQSAEYTDAVVAAARAALPPELYNRLDEVLAFAPLSRADVAEVARRMLAGLANDLERQRGVRLDASDAALEALLDQGGFDPSLGARPMRRAIARLVEAPIAEMLLRGEIGRGDVVTLDVEDGKLVVDAVTPTAARGARVA
jgi:ATP-dependent Clp protease ATP-binding subunit ClpC